MSDRVLKGLSEMTKDDVLKLALEALEQGLDEHWMKTNPLGYDAITAIKAALAAPVQEQAEQLAKLGWQAIECPFCGSSGAQAFPKPAAPIEVSAGPITPEMRRPITPEKRAELVSAMQGAFPTAHRQPLTEERIRELWEGHTVPVFGKIGINPIMFTRAIEAAHKIGGAA